MQPVRRLVLLAFFLGSTVSLLASGRLTPRLVVDGALSMAFVPIIQLGAFGAVYRWRRRPMAFGVAADRFFAGNLPWLYWLFGVAVVAAFVPPTQMGYWVVPIELAMFVPIGWGTWLDIRFFRDDMAATPRGAAGDAALYRAIAWPLITAYFLGIAIWAEVASRLTLF
jgi:hypothetical protein